MTALILQSDGVHLSPRAGRGRIASAIRVRGRLCERGGYRFKHPRHVGQHIVVPKSQDTIVVSQEPFVSEHIVRTVRVLSSVYFNDEAAFPADKIDGVWTDRLLPNKLESVELARPQPIPQCTFRLGRGSPQPSGPPSLDVISDAHAATPPHPDCFGRCFASPSAIRPLPARGERLASRAIQ